MMSRQKKQVVRPLGPTCCPPKISSIRTPSGCSACTSSLSQPREALKETQIDMFLRLRFACHRISTVSCTSLHHLARTTCKRVTSHRQLLLRHPTEINWIKPTREAFRCLKSLTQSLYRVRFPCATPFGHPETSSERIRKRLIFSSTCNSSENNPERLTKTPNMNTSLSKLKGEPNDQTETYNFFFPLITSYVHIAFQMDGLVCVKMFPVASLS